MRIIITGGGGFVGQALARELVGRHELVLVDSRLGGVPGIQGDLCDPATLEKAFAGGYDAVVHLATVPGGAAEQDPAAAKRVNIDATMALLDAAARAGQHPRFIFASSIAVFGDPLPSVVNDQTRLALRMVYGAHKAMIEQWLAAQTRRRGIRSVAAAARHRREAAGTIGHEIGLPERRVSCIEGQGGNHPARFRSGHGVADVGRAACPKYGSCAGVRSRRGDHAAGPASFDGPACRCPRCSHWRPRESGNPRTRRGYRARLRPPASLGHAGRRGAWFQR